MLNDDHAVKIMLTHAHSPFPYVSLSAHNLKMNWIQDCQI